jgi:hypothetical protein
MYQIKLDDYNYAVIKDGVIIYLARTWMEAENYIAESGGEG